MKRSFIRHGYSVALVQRDDCPAAEVVIRAPYNDTQWYSADDVKRIIGQLERELDVYRAAQDMLATAQLLATEEHAI